MKSNLNYRVCEVSPDVANCLKCIASFQYLCDVVSYMMLNPLTIVVLSRDDKGKFVPLSPSSILAYLGCTRDFFVARFGIRRVDDFIAKLTPGDDDERK